MTTALTLWLAVDRTPAHAQDRALPNTGLADPANLVRLYNRGRTGASPNVLTIPLVSFGGLSAEVFEATGQVRLDLRARTLTSRVAGLPEGEWELWLIDNRAATGSSTFADSGGTMVRAGSYRQAESVQVLEAALPAQNMEFDRAMVVRAGRQPTAGFVLAGSATLFERWNPRLFARGRNREPSLAARRARPGALHQGNVRRQRPILRQLPRGAEQLHTRR